MDAALLAVARAPGPDGTPPDPEKTLPDGTTAVWALLWGRELLAAWLGDSRAVLCRWAGPEAPAGSGGSAVPWDDAGYNQQTAATAAESESGRCRGRAAQGERLAAVALTVDHSPARADERARILAAGGTVGPVSDGALETCCAPMLPCCA